MPLFELLQKQFPDLKLFQNEPMARRCSFRLGGAAEVLAEPRSEAELAALVRCLRSEGAAYFILGNGTNVLVPDEGVRGAVIHIGEDFGALRAEGETLTAGAGAALSRAAVLARDAGLGGMEFAHGIPGSVGGAVYMNAGAYGGEMRDILLSVRCLDPDGEIREYTGAELALGYRTSRFAKRGGVVLSAKMQLHNAPPSEIGARMHELWEKRSASQPLDKPSAGSAFKRPQTGYAAAMIDGAGLKGLTVGGAQVSTKHAGFIINAGGATCADVQELMSQVQTAVREKYGVTLEPEIRVLR
ncbi:MAG: UDP-N-acetylmuramate dehydrogenase [Oscillospiraceae bacterium]|nr:UDP-N-acetylmuramate dehydrogenase [Oscillospiraceae bacterium]